MNFNLAQVGLGIALAIYFWAFFMLFHRMSFRRGFSRSESIAWGIAGCVPPLNVVLFVILILIRPKSTHVAVR